MLGESSLNLASPVIDPAKASVRRNAEKAPVKSVPKSLLVTAALLGRGEQQTQNNTPNVKLARKLARRCDYII
jgi:hypothetical protein